MTYLDSRIMVNPFRHKLTFAFRCAIFADHFHRGTPYPVLAQAFGVSNQVVALICRSKNSRLYHSIFLEFDRIGDMERMWNQYVRDAGVQVRIDNTAWERKIGGTVKEYQIDSGQGKYWVKNYEGDEVQINIRAYEDIKDQVDTIIGEEYRHGFYFKHPQTGWTFEEEPFINVGEALRYFAKFPPTWDK
jgi:hypothetical protein